MSRVTVTGSQGRAPAEDAERIWETRSRRRDGAHGRRTRRKWWWLSRSCCDRGERHLEGCDEMRPLEGG
jgi:hypothetical protein